MADKLGSYKPSKVWPTGLPRRTWLSLLGTALFWLAPIAILLSIVGAIAGILSLPGSLGGFLGAWAVLLIVFAVDGSLRRMRRRNGEILLGYVEAAVRLNLPLNAFLKSAMASEGGRRWVELDAMVRGLESGQAVGTALVAATDIPEDSVAPDWAAEALGQLRLGLAEEIARQRQMDEDNQWWRDTVFYRFYPLILLLIFVFFLVFVVPKFRDIFKDFRTDLPRMTLVVIHVSDWFINSGIVIAVLVLAIVMGLLSLLAVSMNRFFLPRIDRVWAWMAWRLPFFHGMQRDRGMADCCELLATAVRNGVPLGEGVLQCLALPVNNGLRSSLAAFHEHLVAGRAPADAAREAGLPQLLSGILTPLSTAAVGESGEMFEFLAAYYRQRFSRTVQLLRAGLEPGMVMAAGFLVMCFVMAMFLPLVTLINSVSGNGGGAL